MKRTSDGLPPIPRPTATPPQDFHPRTPNLYRFHCGRWKHERGWSELIFASSAFTITPFPTHLLRHRHSPTGRVKLEQSTTNRCEIDGQDQTAKFLGLTNNSTVEGGGNLDDHNYPFPNSELSSGGDPEDNDGDGGGVDGPGGEEGG